MFTCQNISLSFLFWKESIKWLRGYVEFFENVSTFLNSLFSNKEVGIVMHWLKDAVANILLLQENYQAYISSAISMIWLHLFLFFLFFLIKSRLSNNLLQDSWPSSVYTVQDDFLVSSLKQIYFLSINLYFSVYIFIQRVLFCLIFNTKS